MGAPPAPPSGGRTQEQPDGQCKASAAEVRYDHVESLVDGTARRRLPATGPVAARSPSHPPPGAHPRRRAGPASPWWACAECPWPCQDCRAGRAGRAFRQRICACRHSRLVSRGWTAPVVRMGCHRRDPGRFEAVVAGISPDTRSCRPSELTSRSTCRCPENGRRAAQVQGPPVGRLALGRALVGRWRVSRGSSA